MASSSLPFIVGGAALGLGVVWLRSRQAKQEVGDKPNPCEGLSALGVPKGACDALLPLASQVLGAVGDALFTTSADIKERDAKNRELNGGAVDVPMTKAVQKIAWVAPSVHNVGSALRGSALRFANGCVPFKGTLGWAKCAEGTHDMRNRPNDTDPWFEWQNLMSGRDGDPASSGPWESSAAGGAHGTRTDFPLPLADGEHGWFYKGRPFKCSAATPPDFNVRDHRGDVESIPCGGPTRPYTPPSRPILGGDDAPAVLDPTRGPSGGVTVTATPGGRAPKPPAP